MVGLAPLGPPYNSYGEIYQEKYVSIKLLLIGKIGPASLFSRKTCILKVP